MLLFALITALFGSAKMSTLQEEVHAARREALQAKAIGPYTLKHHLGQGGMGQVYLAEHRLLKRPCAVKLILPELGSDPSAQERFVREVRTTAQLKHSNTVQVYDYGRTEDGTFYYVMEYLDGVSLKEIVRRWGPLPPARVVYFLQQLCGALREAHGQGLIHRDIKPNNIMICRHAGAHDVIKLLDFGLVKSNFADRSTPDITEAGVLVGTPAFMSPEQTEGAVLDGRSDLYSLGATAFFLLTGRPPFSGKNNLDVLIAHRQAPIPPLRVKGSDIPAGLEVIVRRCLAKAPADRYESVDKLERALQELGTSGLWSEEHAKAWWNSV